MKNLYDSTNQMISPNFKTRKGKTRLNSVNKGTTSGEMQNQTRQEILARKFMNFIDY